MENPTDPAEALQNEAERLRVRVGFSKPQFERFVDGLEGDDLKDALATIEREYDDLRIRLKASVDAEAARPIATVDGEPALSTSQLGRAFGIGDFFIVTLRRRRKLKTSRAPDYRYPVFRVSDVYEMIDRPTLPKEHRSPIALILERRLTDKLGESIAVA